MADFRRSAALAGAVFLFLLSACSDDSKPTVSSGSPSSSSSSSASLGVTTTTAIAEEGCAASAPPASAVDVTQANGDFDGDGTTDTLTVYGTGTTTEPSPYHLQVELADSHGTIDTAIADAATDNSQRVKALGGADITASAGLPPDGSGDEIFVQVGSGASASLVGVFQLIGCTITRLTGPQGTQPSLFAIGGSVTHLDGLRCEGTAGGQRLVQLSATSDDGVTYEAVELQLQVQTGAFTVLGAPGAENLDGSDPRLQSFSSLECAGVSSP